MDILPTGTSFDLLSKYSGLFRKCFPTASHLDVAYLDWLYRQNPAGSVIGYDAWDGETLAAHYVCIPVDAVIGGAATRILLSLNTATDPEYQGKGLFTRLAAATYDAGAKASMGAVYGVANENSTPGFIRKLGFSLIRPLDARIGIGRISYSGPNLATRNSEFHRVWSRAALDWRIANPCRRYRLVGAGDDAVGAEAPTGIFGVRAWAEVPLPEDMPFVDAAPSLSFHLHLGLQPSPVSAKPSPLWVDIPQRFKPSPLNMIFRPLTASTQAPDKNAILLGQLDFDAY